MHEAPDEQDVERVAAGRIERRLGQLVAEGDPRDPSVSVELVERLPVAVGKDDETVELPAHRTPEGLPRPLLDAGEHPRPSAFPHAHGIVVDQYARLSVRTNSRGELAHDPVLELDEVGLPVTDHLLEAILDPDRGKLTRPGRHPAQKSNTELDPI